MSENNMPVTEAAVVSDDRNHYEFAFHVLPTVAEGEVPAVVEAIKQEIVAAGGEITIEEMPRRVELAYEIVKPIEGKNRRFTSAYFGWIRFAAEPAPVSALTSELESVPQLLRCLVIKLTRVEEEHPFYFHAAAEADQRVTTVGDDDAVALEEDADNDDVDESPVAEDADTAAVSEDELEESLQKNT